MGIGGCSDAGTRDAAYGGTLTDKMRDWGGGERARRLHPRDGAAGQGARGQRRLTQHLSAHGAIARISFGIHR
jgi:hypothetical protein